MDILLTFPIKPLLHFITLVFTKLTIHFLPETASVVQWLPPLCSLCLKYHNLYFWNVQLQVTNELHRTAVYQRQLNVKENNMPYMSLPRTCIIIMTAIVTSNTLRSFQFNQKFKKINGMYIIEHLTYVQN